MSSTAVIENVHGDLNVPAIGKPLPSGKFDTKAAWLIAAVVASNLTRAGATLTGSSQLARGITLTIRRKPINRQHGSPPPPAALHLRLPRDWPSEHA